MLKNFALWFIYFGLSFLVQSWGWAEQGKAFMYLYLGVTIISIIIVIACVVIAGFVGEFAAEASGLSLRLALLTAVALAVTLFATWGATQLFEVDFYTAYMIMTFGQCLSSNNKKKKD